jgi:hypothetical protein
MQQVATAEAFRSFTNLGRLDVNVLCVVGVSKISLRLPDVVQEIDRIQAI